jgi:GNAT superfamily N-acetyltransferase
MIHIRLLTDADLVSGQALSEQAGWNQTPADWQRCLDLEPAGCFTAELDGAVAGTATTCVFGGAAWVAMVLVAERFRRRGIGQALMEHALAYLDGVGVRTVRLDATPMGQPLYERLGFRPQFLLTRYAGELPEGGAEPAEVVTVPPERWPELLALDEAVTRTDRRKLLLRLFAEQPDEVRGVEGPAGWRGLMTIRRGRQAVQLGPCLGEAAASLLADACRRHAGRRAYLDVPDDNQTAARIATGWGLTRQRQLLRMFRGEPVIERIEWLFASSGPEKG